LEYIGAPVSLLRDTIMHYQQFNENASELHQQFKKLPHSVTGVTPTIPYPKNLNHVLSGEFTKDQIVALLKFYYQTPTFCQNSIPIYISPLITQPSESPSCTPTKDVLPTASVMSRRIRSAHSTCPARLLTQPDLTRAIS